MSTIEVRVPDIGDFAEVPVIEVLVKPGDTVAKDASLITLESEKASMEVPSSAAGVIDTIDVKVGDKVAKGTLIATLKTSDGTAPAPPPTVEPAAKAANGTANENAVVEIRVPDIGDFKDIPVIDVLVKPGDRVEKEASLITLESEKAAMDVPSTTAGTIIDLQVKPGDKVSKGTLIAKLRPTAAAATQPKPEPRSEPTPPPTASANVIRKPDERIHASPAIRRFARELGVDLHGVRGNGPNGRVTREDVQSYVKDALKMQSPAQGGFGIAGLPAWPKIDFAQFGAVDRQPLSRIKKISGPSLHRNWLQIPHITNYDEADITQLEAFRNDVNAEQAKSGAAKLTMLAFLVKASVAALQRFPEFNASLDGDDLVYKRYYNVGFAADTPNGLVVPVLKSANQKGLLDIAGESGELAAKARAGKLGLGDMQGGTFTISSIGGIGGTQFTQIVNAPEVAILGATRAAMKPVWDGTAFQPRLVLPVSVSYDHRVIDGALAARFLVYLTSLLHDFRRILL